MVQKRRKTRDRDYCSGSREGVGMMQGMGNFMLGAATLMLGAGVLASIVDIFRK